MNNDLINKSKEDDNSNSKEMDKDDSINIDPEAISKKRNYNYIKSALIKLNLLKNIKNTIKYCY